MTDFDTMMRSRQRYEREIEKLDARFLKAVLPLLRVEVEQRGKVHETDDRELAELFNVPRSVLRKALGRLAKEGFAETQFDGLASDFFVYVKQPSPQLGHFGSTGYVKIVPEE